MPAHAGIQVILFKTKSRLKTGFRVLPKRREERRISQSNVVLDSLEAGRKKQFFGLGFLFDHPLLVFVANNRL
jgi:hypothetical protein